MKKKRRVLILFLASYILVASLPLFSTISLYYNDMAQNIDETLLREARETSRNAMSVIDSHLSIINNLPYQLYENQTILDYKNAPDTLRRKKVIELLRQIIGGNELIEDIYLYFRAPQTFVSAYSNSYDAVSMRVYGPISGLYYEEMPYDEMLDALASRRESAVWPAQSVRVGSQNAMRIVTFYNTLPIKNRYAYASMLTLVNVRQLNRLVGGVRDDGYLLCDYQGNIILNRLSAQGPVAALPPEVFGEAEGARFFSFGDAEYALSWAHSSVSGWRIVQASPALTPAERTFYLRSRTVVVTCALSLALAVLIAVFMKKTYMPVGNLYAMAYRLSADAGDAVGNAFSAIEGTMRQLHAKNAELTEQINRHSGDQTERVARLLISCAQWTPSLYEEAAASGLKTDAQVYQVVILHYREIDQMNRAIERFKEACGELYISSLIENVYGQPLVILGGAKSEKALFDRSNLASLNAEILAVGPEVTMAEQWNASYNAALMISSHALLHRREQRVYHIGDVPDTACSFADDSWLMIQNFASAVYQNNEDILRKAGKDITAYICKDTTNIIEAKMVICQSLSRLRERLPEYMERIDAAIRQIYLGRTEIDAATMCGIFDALTETLCKCVRQEKESAENPLIRESLAYIHENIGSPELSLATVAERAGLSDSRYSLLFRQAMMCNYKSYVDALRLAKAKKLLESGDDDIAFVAGRVGYNNAYSFVRFFKKETGVSPKEYRHRRRGE